MREYPGHDEEQAERCGVSRKRPSACLEPKNGSGCISHVFIPAGMTGI